MNITSSYWNAEIARLVAEKADPERISAARERRASAERQEAERETALLLERIEVRSGDYRRRGLLLDGEELRLLAAEIRRLQGGAEGIGASAVLAQTRETQRSQLQAAVLNLRGRKA